MAADVDVLYQTRIQKERFQDRPEDYEKAKGAACWGLVGLALAMQPGDERRSEGQTRAGVCTPCSTICNASPGKGLQYTPPCPLRFPPCPAPQASISSTAS